MIRADQLSIEVMNEFHAALLHGESYAEAFAAALSAWPNVFVNGSSESIFVCCHSLVLPLPTETRDE